jgi:hypothetical protein
MFLARHQNVVRDRDIKIENRSFENVSQFKYLGMTVTNQNFNFRVMHPAARVPSKHFCRPPFATIFVV